MLRYLYRKLKILSIGLAFTASTYAEDLHLWQVVDKNVMLYQTPDNASQQSESLQSGQVLLELAREKDWCKLANPKNGKVGWIPCEQLKTAIQMTIAIDQSSNLQKTHVSITGPEANQEHTWQFAQWGSSKSKSNKNLELAENECQQALQMHWQAFDEMRDHFFETWPTSRLHFPTIQPTIIIVNPDKQSPEAVKASQNIQEKKAAIADSDKKQEN
jgi:hypothetical protein